MMRALLMKSVAAACLACAFAAQAAPVSVPVGGSFTGMDPAGAGQVTTVSLVGGSGSWTMSNGGWTPSQDYANVTGLVGALNVFGAMVVGTGEILPAEELGVEIWPPIRTGVRVYSQVESVSLDNVTGQILSVANAPGAVQFNGTRVPGVLTGGTAAISNFRFDLANKTVVADLMGLNSAVGTRPSVAYNLPGATLWTFADVAMASEVIDSTTFASTLTFSGLILSTEGYNFLANSLGLLSTGKQVLSATADHGSIQTRLVFSTAVPEPSTYALLGVGLVGLLVGLRRRVAEN